MSRIVLVGPAWPLRAGGMSTFNERLAREFQSQGHTVSMLTFSLQYPAFLFPGKTQLSDEAQPADLKIDILINSVNPFSWLKAAWFLAKQRPDLVIYRYWMPFMAPCLGSIARWSRWFGNQAKQLAIADNVLPHEKFPFSKQLARYFLHSIDKVVTMSQAVTEELKLVKYTRPSLRLPHPLYDNFGSKVSRNEAIQALKLNPDFQYFLFFGFIRQYKGLDLLLQAFADDRLKKHKVKLLVAGEFYDNPDRYYRLIREHKLVDRVVMHTDFIPNEAVKYYFSAASLVTQTYHHATQSGVTQIGFHFDVPMLVTNVGGLSELISEGKSGYVTETNQQSVADAMLDFIENDRFEAFSKEVAVLKQQFSWSSFAKQLAD